MKRPFSNRRLMGEPGRAFTLIEVLITMVVFILLAGCVFGILTGILEGSSTLQENQDHQDKVVALENYVRAKLTSMPGGSQFISYEVKGGSPHSGILFDLGGQAMALDTILQPDGLYTLRVAFYQPDSSLVSILPSAQMINAINADQPLVWVSLLHDIKRLDWRFQVPNSNIWTDTLNGSTIPPTLVELTLQLAGDSGPIVSDFWIPPLQSSAITIAPSPHG